MIADKTGRARAQSLLCSHFGPFGNIKFPYYGMGNIDSLDLFGIHTELEIMAIYFHNRNRWHRVLDIGANLGLHSILMARLLWTVKAFEPDFEHYQRLLENLDGNHVRHLVTPHMAAVSTKDGEANFIRVMNNLTGNHLEGYKNSYGPTQKVIVPTVDCRNLWRWADFAKIDSEGNEADLLRTTTVEDMLHLSIVCEVRNEANAQAIFDHFFDLGTPIWSQKIDWHPVQFIDQMPKVNREGSIYIGHKGPWA